jgi:uncharacterized damage-inducible protein DinB
MSRARHLGSSLERTMTGPMWHGPALADVLKGVTAERAAAHPIAGAHSIWEIVLHVVAWVEIARARLKGQRTGDATPEEDWPPVTATDEAAWRRALERLAACHREIGADARAFDEARLDQKLANLEYSADVLLRGIVEHGTYHGGQIALLKKADA